MGTVTIRLHAEEPAAGPWRVERIQDVIAAIAERARPTEGRPLVVAIDGRSSSGKSTLAGHIAAAVPASAVVHTDDIAWGHSRFGWADLAQRVLQAVQVDAGLSFRPPGWDNVGRPGAVTVPRGTRLLLLEGVGSSREELADLVKVRFWVQSDGAVTAQRNEARIATGETTHAQLAAWMDEELPFIAARRPWEQADLIAAGTPTLDYDPLTEIVVADGPLLRGLSPRV